MSERGDENIQMNDVVVAEALIQYINSLRQPENEVHTAHTSHGASGGHYVYTGDEWLNSLSEASTCTQRRRPRVHSGEEWFATMFRRRARYLRS